MAKRSHTVTGLEIEPTAVHAASVSVSGTIRIEHAAIAPLDPGVVRDGEVQDPLALAEALRELFAQHKELDKRVRFGVANAKIVVRLLELPPIAETKELDAAVRFQAQDAIPMPIESAVLDWHPLDVVETEAGPRQRVLLVAARRDMVEKVLMAAQGAGLKPEGVDLSAFAMVRALHRDEPAVDPELPAGATSVLYLAVGGLTNLAVAQGTTCLFTRVLGGGLEALAVELAERRQIALGEARAALTRAGLEGDLDVDDPDVDLLLDARAALDDGVTRIASDVRNTLDFHVMQDGAAAPVGRVVLAGEAATLPGFAAALGLQLGLPVEPAIVAGAPLGLEAATLAIAAGLGVTEAPADARKGGAR
ncbi:type IV pilus assembly protein PilM [Conexibacter sp. SYSU D00693]|uniref:type IV pilus assembly protein PilM n=1 Tax=Conexibacter sp. SYSU D00693 TaxID=2812560 RepID=UPI00196AF78C|nr:type IV pilus assembly protein PilM [Conexibacter sp. SYSU D00693]